MLNTLMRSGLVALTIGTGFIGLGAVPAAAQDVRIVIGDDLRVEPVQYRDRDRRGCSSRLAIRKAYDIGLNRPRIVRENRRFVVVDGVRRGRLATVRFANDRGCPVLNVRR